METGQRAKSWIGTTIVCVAIGAGSYFGMIWLLESRYGPVAGPGEVTLAPSIEAEANDFVADLRAAAQIVTERWSYREHRAALEGVDVEALEERALAMLGEQPDPGSFQRAITFLIAGLHDGHASVVTPEGFPEDKHRWPLSLVEVEEGILVNGVDEGVEGVARGDLLLAVDGRPIEQWITEAESFVCSSTDPARRRYAIERLASRDGGSHHTYRFAAQDGEEYETVLPLLFGTVAVPDPELVSREREHRMLTPDIGYFRPGNFSPPPNSGWPGPPEGRDAILAETYAAFDAIIGELSGARALILDLRGNPGGTDLLGQFLVDRLVEGDYVYFQLASQGAIGWRGFGSHGSSAPPGEHSLAGKPLLCLLDEATFSTADNVAAALADVHPDVTFLGRPNGAGTGAPRPFDLPRTGTRIRFCTQRVRTPKGRMAEGISIELDVPIRWTREDVLAGRDPDLEAAVSLLEE